MDLSIFIGIAVVGIIFFAVLVPWIRRGRLFSQARAFVSQVQNSHALPTVATNVILKPGEAAFYSAPSVLYETRAVRHYESGRVGVRVAKGIYIGGSKGHSISTQEWSKVGMGHLTVTSKRLIFEGGNTDRAIQLGKVVSVGSNLKQIEVSVEGRQKPMLFDAPNPLILTAIIRICCQVEDPSDLSQTVLNIKFAE